MVAPPDPKVPFKLYRIEQMGDKIGLQEYMTDKEKKEKEITNENDR